MNVKGKYLKMKDNIQKNNAEIFTMVKNAEYGMTERRNEEGALNISVGAIIGFAIGLIVLAAVVPDAIGTFYQTDTSAWTIDGVEDSKTTVLWWLIPLVVVASVVMMIYKGDF